MAGRKANFVKATEETCDQVQAISENLRDAALKLFEAARSMEKVDYAAAMKLWKEANRFNGVAWSMQASVDAMPSQGEFEDQENYLPSAI